MHATDASPALYLSKLSRLAARGVPASPLLEMQANLPDPPHPSCWLITPLDSDPRTYA